MLVQSLTGAEVRSDLGTWAGVYEDVYAADLHLPDHNDPPIAEQLTRHSERPGFRLYGAFDGDEAVGYCYGYTFDENTFWWDDFVPDTGCELVGDDPGEFTREWPGRTAAGCQILVRKPWRQRGIAVTLNEAFVADRAEERIAGHIAEVNGLMLSLYVSYGWVRVGTVTPFPGWGPHIAVVRPLKNPAHV